MTELRLDWATHGAARYACEKWHYAGVLPTGKLVKVGVWEDGEFVGVIVFSRGASPFLGRKWGLDQTQVCELTRVALREHATPVSRILSIAVKFLRRRCPGVRLVVSFADPTKGHHGGVYQAAGWTFTGSSGETVEYFVDGRWRHVGSVYGGGDGEVLTTAKNAPGRWRHKKGVYYDLKERGLLERVQKRTMPGKYRYVLALDPELAARVREAAQPYPKRAGA